MFFMRSVEFDVVYLEDEFAYDAARKTAKRRCPKGDPRGRRWWRIVPRNHRLERAFHQPDDTVGSHFLAEETVANTSIANHTHCIAVVRQRSYYIPEQYYYYYYEYCEVGRLNRLVYTRKANEGSGFRQRFRAMGCSTNPERGPYVPSFVLEGGDV